MRAHTPGPNGWHSLEDHLRAVAEATRHFADKFECGELGRRLGITHDLAKADPAFQKYLLACHSGKYSKKCPHAIPSAVAARHLLGNSMLAVIGHHTGMPDLCDVKTKLQDADSDSVAYARELLIQLASGLEGLPQLPTWVVSGSSTEMLFRMAFSCLVDADYLDTENHFYPHLKDYRGKFPSLKDYLGLLQNHLATFDKKEGGVNQVRAEIQKSCLDNATKPRGAFRLTVPTGGGKTLSGLGFALSHAEYHGMDRVIVAIPYTSIIDQTAVIYKGVFGEVNVLEHHSALDIDTDDEAQDDFILRRRLNTQNWDCPLVVTTTVQLFESLLHNRPAQCRKLHNIVNSVIVLDEVQALPPECLKPIFDVLNELVSYYGCSVVFCTATQLDYSVVDDHLLKGATEIVPGYPRHFEVLKRVKYEIVNEPWSVERIAQEIENEKQVLAVFNTRKDALAVAKAVGDSESILHLSTLLCGHHRKWVIDKVKQRIKDGEEIRLISTQVVEAGVDLDFPVVYRDVGPLDRIIQVGGRCNREGKFDFGRCVVFPLEGGGSPQGVYAAAINKTRTLLDEYGERLDDPQALREFSHGIFGYTNLGEDIQKMRADLKYNSVASNFNLIDTDTVPLIVSSYRDVEDEVEMESLIKSWDDRPRGWFQKVAPYTVTVFKYICDSLQSRGLVYEHESGAWIYSGGYDPTFGLTGDFADPADLVG